MKLLKVKWNFLKVKWNHESSFFTFMNVRSIINIINIINSRIESSYVGFCDELANKFQLLRWVKIIEI
jgi:hypothetical protein